ncbi:hypothetical protein HMPREF3198_00420 [Winkia neuii]|nr:hypothetical protein HMPREF3198_00420 [Winkia neuii]
MCCEHHFCKFAVKAHAQLLLCGMANSHSYAKVLVVGLCEIPG